MNSASSDITKERLFNEFNTVIAETEQLLKSVASMGGDKAGALKSNVQDGLAAAGERLARIRAESMSQATAAAAATDEYVKQNPWRAVGVAASVAALAGLVLGLLASRR
jgi:ElaB/YqjD/DUF883 family membrane-anchored ribosome-binding protein